MKIITNISKDDPAPPRSVRLVSENEQERLFLASILRNTEDWNCYPHHDSGLVVRFYGGEDYGRLIKFLYTKNIPIFIQGADNA